jgi:hypothetical protein
MFIRNLKTVGALLLLGMIGVALAAAPAGEPKTAKEPVKAVPAAPAKAVPPLASFDALDADDDGRIAKSEVPDDDALAARFATYDLDKSDTLTRKEYARYGVNAADDLFADDGED